MENCFIPYFITIILFIITFTFIAITINLDKELQETNLIGLYDIKDDESFSQIVNIRKNDGKSCNISIIYEDGEKIIKKNPEPGPGSACLG